MAATKQTDYYIQHPEALEGQPKRAIAEYVKQNGLLIPRIFGSLAEARASGLPIIARSEHVQDYNGASGILISPLLSDERFSGVRSTEELKHKVLAEPENETSTHKQYCRFLRLDEDKFKQEVSFSFWELLDGYNRKIVADSSIPNRHHIMTSRYMGDDTDIKSYVIVDNGKVTSQHVTALTAELESGVTALIEFYEAIRSMDRFDRNHCPIIEVQTLNGNNYFLQYHRTRDFESAVFTLDRGPSPGEIEMPFVRGATPPEGTVLRTTLAYAGQPNPDFDITKPEDGSFDLHYCKVFSELMVRKRKLLMITLESDTEDLEFKLSKEIFGHEYVSMLFKPQVSAICDIYELIRDAAEASGALHRAVETGKNQHINLQVISDGKKAYVKRV